MPAKSPKPPDPAAWLAERRPVIRGLCSVCCLTQFREWIRRTCTLALDTDSQNLRWKDLAQVGRDCWGFRGNGQTVQRHLERCELDLWARFKVTRGR